MLGKDKLIYDATTPDDGDSVAAYLRTAAGALTSTGAAGALDVNITNALAVAVDLNGDYDGVSNLAPDSVGAIVHDRAAAPAVADQNKRTTGAAASSDAVVAANAHGFDANSFGMIFNGTTWDRMRGTSGALNVVFSEPVADDAADAGNPLKVGTRAVSGALAAVSATGDRANMISDLYRRLWVNTSPNIAGSNAAVTVDDTAGGVVIFTSVLAGRTRAIVKNMDNKPLYLGFGTVTVANGMPVEAGALWLGEIGPDLILKGIRATGETGPVRTMQFA